MGIHVIRDSEGRVKKYVNDKEYKEYQKWKWIKYLTIGAIILILCLVGQCVGEPNKKTSNVEHSSSIRHESNSPINVPQAEQQRMAATVYSEPLPEDDDVVVNEIDDNSNERLTDDICVEVETEPNEVVGVEIDDHSNLSYDDMYQYSSD